MNNEKIQLKNVIKTTILIEKSQKTLEAKKNFKQIEKYEAEKADRRLDRLESLSNIEDLKELAEKRTKEYPITMERKPRTLTHSPRLEVVKLLKTKRKAQESFTIKDLVELNPALKYVTVRAIVLNLVNEGLLKEIEHGRGQGSQSRYAFPMKLGTTKTPIIEGD